MTRPTLLLILLLMSSPACSAPGSNPEQSDSSARFAEAPAWVITPYEHPSVRRSVHMAGVGWANGTGGGAREIAVQKALTDVTQTILSAIRSTVLVATNERRENDDVTWTEELDQTIRVDSEGELPGYDVIDSWTDEQNGETVVLLVVSRELLASTLFPKIEQALAEADEFLDTPPELSQTRPAEALFRALQAYAVLSARMLDATKAQVVAANSRLQPQAQSNFNRATTLLDETSRRLAALSGSIRIDKISGDGQRSAVRGALAQPLTARLSVVDAAGNTHPLARFPARFVAAVSPGPALAHSASSTDDRGLISCRVSDLVPTGQAANEIFVEPDFGRLAPGIGRSRIPSESFVYHLPTSGQTSVLVLVTDTFEGAPLASQISAEALGDHLSSFGFDVLVVDPSSAAGRRLDALEEGDLAQAIAELHADRFEYFIHGRSSTRYSSKTPVGHFYYSLAALQVDNLISGSSQAVTTSEVKGGHPVQGVPGINKALTALQRVLARDIDEQFVSEFVIETEPNS